MAPSNTKSAPWLWVPIVLEIGLSLYGFWTLWGFPYSNGLLKILKSETEPGAMIPGPTKAPMRQHYTGIKLVDNQLTVLVSFFYTAVDGNRGDLSLTFLGLGGAVLAAWTLVTLEGLRAGNKSRILLTSNTVFGAAVAIVGYACVSPLWFAYHLYASSTVVEPEPWNLLVDNTLEIVLSPIASSIGFGVPSFIMSFPAPAVLSFNTKQLWAGIQQGWSLWIKLTTTAMTFVVSLFNPDYVVMTPDGKKARTIKNLRLAYLFALGSATAAHLIPWAFSILAYVWPVLFAEPFRSQFQPINMMIPVNPFGNLQAQTLADGGLWFLQWDAIVGTISTGIWGLTLRAAAKNESATPMQWVAGSVKLAVLGLAVGPTGAAVIAVWARDELVLRRSADSGTLSKRGKAN